MTRVLPAVVVLSILIKHLIMPDVVMLSHNTECLNTACHYAKYLHTACYSAKCHAEHPNTACLHAEYLNRACLYAESLCVVIASIFVLSAILTVCP
jgi:hypothetical protein